VLLKLFKLTNNIWIVGLCVMTLYSMVVADFCDETLVLPNVLHSDKMSDLHGADHANEILKLELLSPLDDCSHIVPPSSECLRDRV